MGLAMWYIGQRIVAVKDHPSKDFKKGDEFTALGIKADCCDPGVSILIHLPNVITKCPKCGHLNDDSWLYEEYFSPLQSFGEEVTERISNEIGQEVEV